LKKTAYYALTRQGAELAQRIIARAGGDLFISRRLDLPVGQAFDSLPELVAGTFHAYRAHVFVSAAGIALRCIAPHIVHKASDPAVLVCDQRGEHVVSLLSGHVGGANALAEQVAAITGGRAVITTATDGKGLPAQDMPAPQAKIFHAGIGCRKNTPAEAIRAALDAALAEAGAEADAEDRP